MRGYRDLKVFEAARVLTKETYRQIVPKLPPSEIYALSSQIRRAVTSIAFNIAEGYGRGTEKEKIRFLYIARGSAYELEAQLIVCVDLGYLTEPEIDEVWRLEKQVARMLNGLITFFETRSVAP